MIMKKRHAYNLAILLAAGTIMMSACGKKTDAPADTTAPAQTESQNFQTGRNFIRNTGSGRCRKQQILYAPGNHYKN